MANELDRFHLLYAGSVKNVRSHPEYTDESAFEFTDDYSVFDWGKMPDPIPGKGAALLAMAVHFFELLENPNSWKIFFNSPLGKEFEAECNQAPHLQSPGVKEKIQRERMALASHGLRTHYRGFVPSSEDEHRPVALRVENLNAVRPKLHTIFGETVPDYAIGQGREIGARNAPSSLIPLEVVFRFELTKASSLLKRRPDAGFTAGQKFTFPYVECFTKLEDSDRALGLPEALYVGRIDAGILEDVLLKTAFVSSYLRFAFRERGLELLDGKLEWGLNKDGKIVLADAIGPDELRVTANGISLSKELLREHYRKSEWFAECEDAKKKVGETGDWQKLVKSKPTPLPEKPLTAVRDLYRSLANTLIGREVFPAPELSKVTSAVAEVLRS